MEETRILVVDDEQEIADLLELYLISDGYQVIKSEDALEGLAIMEREKIDLVLLDIMMPKMDGLEMCRKIREKHNVPIIMVSAKTQELDKIVGLTTGADDYVTKPFNPLELMARVKSQLRRYRDLNPANEKKGAEDSTIRLNHVTIIKETHQVFVDGESIKLTPFCIFWLLIRVGCSVRMRFLKKYGMRRYMRPIIPLWYISVGFVAR